ncbi:MAG: superfamily II DNA or RNA helicase [Planctomycetota bacterium]|jgi:superfamily II DNA or RNA helicase
MAKTRSKLTASLKPFFPDKTRKKGASYLEDQHVNLITHGENGANGCVSGDNDYVLCIRWGFPDEQEEASGYCSCPAFEIYGPCKHLWAFSLELDRYGVGPDWQIGPKGFYKLNSVTTDLKETEDDLGMLEDAYLGDDSHWQDRLVTLEKQATTVRDPWKVEEHKDLEIRYMIDVAATERYGPLRLQVSSHKRKKNGECATKGETYIYGRRGSNTLSDPMDLSIHTALQGANDVGYYGFTMGSDGYRLEPAMYARLLPELVSSGRLYLRRSDNKVHGPLQWDEGETWHFKPSIERNTKRMEVSFSGDFIRGTESISLDLPRLIMGEGYLIVGDRIAKYEPKAAAKVIQSMREDGALRVPLAAEALALATLIQIPGFSELELTGSQLLRGQVPTPHLSVEPHRNPRESGKTMNCSLSMDYGGELVEIVDSYEFITRRDDGRLFRRDFEFENAAVQLFLESGGTRHRTAPNELDSACVSIDNLGKLVQTLLPAGWKITAQGKQLRTPSASKFSVQSGVDWFDLHGGFEFGNGQVAALPQLLAAAKEGRDRVILDDGSMGVLPQNWMKSWGLLELAGNVEGDTLRFAKHQGWLLDALLTEHDGVLVDLDFKQFQKQLRDFKGMTPKQEPKSFQGELREYQREGLGWLQFLRKLSFGGCLADDMGLGKTVQVLAMLEARRLTRRRNLGAGLPSLVVAPRSVVFNWIDEARRFAPKLRVLEYTGTGRAARLERAESTGLDLIVTTYGTLRRDILALREKEFDYAILDEAQAIKNPGSQSAKSARLLDARNRLALSGTPIENHLGELWSLFEFLNPGMLGASKAFEHFSKSNGQQSSEDLERLSRAIAPFFLRRTKGEVLKDLPEKTEQVLHCKLEGKQRTEYTKLRNFYRASLTKKAEEVGLPKMKIQVLEALLRLRQAACHPGLIDKGRSAEDSAKLDVLMPMLESICAEGNKALIFSQFTSLLSIVREKLNERGLVYEYLDGRTRDRKARVERFQADNQCPLFLISIKAGGSGLNLTAADYVFILDPWWNPAVEAQAIDRVHRIGRTKPVMAYRLIASDTVEEKIVELQQQKRELAESVLSGTQVGLRDMTREDLEALLS